jgi:hypothetical protein
VGVAIVHLHQVWGGADARRSARRSAAPRPVRRTGPVNHQHTAGGPRGADEGKAVGITDRCGVSHAATPVAGVATGVMPSGVKNPGPPPIMRQAGQAAQSWSCSVVAADPTLAWHAPWPATWENGTPRTGAEGACGPWMIGSTAWIRTHASAASTANAPGWRCGYRELRLSARRLMGGGPGKPPDPGEPTEPSAACQSAEPQQSIKSPRARARGLE